jgi:rhamnosyltransferase subunit B
MRILIYAMGSAGDVHPFAGIGRALQSRGHEVFVITSPYFEDVVRRAGLEFRPMGSIADFERVQADPHLWHPTKALPSIIRNAVDPSYEPILEHARELHLPDRTVILASSLGWGAMVAKELLGIPVATVHLAPSLFISSHRQPVLHGAPVPQAAPGWMKSLQWWAAGKVVDFHVLPALNRFRKSHGLPPARGMLSHWHSPDRVIALFPDWFGPPQPDWPKQTRVTGFPMFDESGLRELPADLEDFLKAGEPPVVFTPGSAMSQGSSFFREAAGALKLLGRRGILLSRFADTIPADLPAGVRHFSYIPFSQVLPRAAALVYHGGVGTCAQALRAGIPHLVQPMAHDQLDNLSRVRELGVGDGLHPRQFKAKRIAAMLDRLLRDPAMKARAVEVSKRFDPAGWMEQTCRLVEALDPKLTSAP